MLNEYRLSVADKHKVIKEACMGIEIWIVHVSKTNI